MFDVQRVLSGSADWLFCRSVSDCSIGVGPNGHFPFRLFATVMPSGPPFTVQCFNAQCWMPSQCPLLLLVFVFSLLLGKYLYCIVMSIFVYYLLTYFVFLESSENSKKEKSVTSAVYYSISHFGTD